MEINTLNLRSETLPVHWNASQKQIYYICEQYFKLSLMCAKNERLLNAFQDPSKTVAFMTDGKIDNEYVWKEEGIPWEGCGMKLPKKTKVILDYETAWPTLYFTKKGNTKETITIKESPLFVQVFRTGPEGMKTIERELLPECDEYKVVLPFDTIDLDNYDAILVMPCFIPNKDMLTKVYCRDNEQEEEVILTSC
ncbi:hypothetical protein [Aquimarina sediminis]|uniref:hypothetical protein n=1 Tax=Aquimarina sediminis TaxID=2070536 RepID=UPI000CA035A0|nr:hypothetical protein [Aquimarina sediminis]